MATIESFEDMIAWQKAQDLAVMVYKLTKSFPPSEKFALTDQIQRASSSVSANIAEGFGRRTLNDKVRFYTIAYGSLLETKNFVYLANRLDYANADAVNEIIKQATDCQKLINALISSLKRNEK